MLFVLEYRIVRRLGFIPGGCGQDTTVPETAPGECRAGEVGPADGYGTVETEEATRGDYEDNPTDRSVAKSAHLVRLRSAAGKGKMRRGEGCVHSIETDGLQYDQQVWQRNETVVGRVERGGVNGQRARAQNVLGKISGHV